MINDYDGDDDENDPHAPPLFVSRKPLSNKVEEVWKSHDWSWMNFLEATEHP